MDDTVAGHASNFGAFSGDFAVVWAGYEQRVDPVHAAVAGEDGAVEIDWPELCDKTVGCGAELLASGSVQPFKDGGPCEFIDDFTALVGGRKHDDPADIWERVGFLDLSHENASHRVSHEVNGLCGVGLLNQGGAHAFSELFDWIFTGRVFDIKHSRPIDCECTFQFIHGSGGAAEPVQQGDLFRRS